MKISKRALFTNPTYNKISSIPISAQVFFWLGYFSFNTIRWGSFYSDYAYSFKSNIIEFTCLKNGIDKNLVKNKKKKFNKKLLFTNSIIDLISCDFLIITVPTPVNKKKFQI